MNHCQQCEYRDAGNSSCEYCEDDSGLVSAEQEIT